MLFLVKAAILFLPLKATVATSIFKLDNNVCVTKNAYLFQYFRSNMLCSHTDDVKLKMPERMKLFVGDLGETHKVTTKDGYILTMFRLRHPNPKAVLLICPPYTSDSELYLSQGNKSVAYIYWLQGYDVWISNHRGTDYSPHHVKLKKSNRLFWDFSFHEIGYYDTKSFVDYIYTYTGTKIVILGHSMSSTTSYVYASMHPEDAAEKVKLIVTTAPVAYVRHIKGLLVIVAPFYKVLNTLSEATGYVNILGQDDIITKLIVLLYNVLPIIKVILPIYASLSCGLTASEFDPTLLGIGLSMMSQQTLKHAYHSGQVREFGRFAPVDYGVKDNFEIYGQALPPEYPLENIRVPMYLIASDSDFMSSMKDVYLLYNRLQPMVKVYGMKTITGINHIDHHFGLHRWAKVWNPILDILELVSNEEMD